MGDIEALPGPGKGGDPDKERWQLRPARTYTKRIPHRAKGD